MSEAPSQDRPYVSSSKSTGGGGFNHEDEVAAYYLAQMLCGRAPFGPASGAVIRVDSQARAEGWLLDDLVLTLQGVGGERRCAISVKSNRQFAPDHAAPADFVRDAWTLFRGCGPMDAGRDLLSLAVSNVPAAVLEDFHTLRDLAEASDPTTLGDAVAAKGFADDGKRRMYESFACPADLTAQFGGGGAMPAARLLARVLVIEFDFPAATSRCRSEAIQACREALRDPSLAAAERLWDDLRSIAREFRPRKGYLDLGRLVARLRGRHALATYPDHRADWTRLDRYTRSQCEDAPRTALGGRMGLPRDDVRQTIYAPADAAGRRLPVCLLGRSGDGKSGCCQRWLGGGPARLWLDARLFDPAAGSDAMRSAERALGVEHPLDELLRSATGTEPRLAIDGVDRLYDEITLAAVARTAKLAADAGWSVVVTCQDEEWERVTRAFGAAGQTLRPVRVGPLSDAELDAVAAAEPRLAGLLARADLRPVLARLKYLDAIVRGLPAAPAAWNEPSTWAGEADVSAWCWRRTVDGTPPSAARSAAAKELARRQADAVRDSVAEDEIDPAHLAAVDALLRDGVCKKVAERITFDHDLLGDWARQRVLVGCANDLVPFLTMAGRAGSPLWLRGLRLWALGSLEKFGSVAEWLATVRAFDAAGERAAADRVLEAIALSAQAASLLDRAWPELAADGELLRRLLARFLHVATVPDPDVVRLLERGGIADAAEWSRWAAAHHRVPLAHHWRPILMALHRHRDDAATHAPLATAKVATLWLRHAGADGPLRREAAELALTTAQQVARALDDREGMRMPDDPAGWSRCEEAERDAYAAVLMASPVLPHEAAAIVLEAARRTGDQTTGDEPGVVHAPPWPRGPARAVSERFREVVLDPVAFAPLAASAPAVAAEVLLAVLIEPPAIVAHPGMLTGPQYDDDRELSIEHVQGWLPPFYTRGPFLPFLRAAPDAAIGAIVELVNFATNRWVARATRDVHGLRASVGPPRPIEVALDAGGGEPARWEGDADVYGWHVGDARVPYPVTSALIALEKWFYDCIDAGDDVAPFVGQILRDSRSVAFAGLLATMARYDRRLLDGPPRPPLLLVPEFLYWEARPRHDLEGSALWCWQLPGRGSKLEARLAETWYAMPHRKEDLRALAVFLFLNDPVHREALRTPVERWRNELNGGEVAGERRAALEDCVATFDPEAWETVQLPDGQRGWHRRVTADEARSQDAVLREADDTLLVLPFPHRCRERLDAAEAPDEIDVEAFWTTFQRVVELFDATPSGSGDANLRRRRAFDGAVGGIAVLLIRCGGWLDAHRDRRSTVLRLLRRLMRTRPPRDPSEGGHPDETSDDIAQCFFAEIIVHFWREKPASAFWRRQAAWAVLGFHLSPIRHLFRAAFAARDQLAGGFEALGHLLLRWSAVRWHAELARNEWSINVDVPAEAGRLIAAFLRFDFASDWPTCREAAEAPAELPDRQPPPPRFRRGLDLPLIAAAFGGILSPSQTNLPDERRRWAAFWQDLVGWRIGPSLGDADTRDTESGDERGGCRRSLYGSDHWLLERAAEAVVHLGPAERPDSIWRPILSLASGPGDQWAKEFLSSLFIVGLRRETHGEFVALWTDIAAYASKSPQWLAADEEAWADLLGIDAFVIRLWHERHAPLLAAMSPVMAEFIRSRLRSRHRLSPLLALLQSPAAEPIRVEFLPPLADAVDARPSLVRDREAAGALARFIDLALRRHGPSIQGRREAFDATSRLLRTSTRI